jgi:tetratricopeptide (TPR) repeat protein
MNDAMRKRRWAGAAAAVVLALGAGGVIGSACTSSDDDRGGTSTRLAEPSDLAGTVSQDLLVALAQAKNFHHKAKVYMTDGNLTEATAAVRQILAIQFPQGAPEAEDVRQDARALLAKLLVAQGKLDEAMRTVDEGIAAATRDSFFLANLHTVRGEVFEAQAAVADDGTPAGKVRAAEAKRAAIGAYDRSIAINEALQKRLAGESR